MSIDMTALGQRIAEARGRAGRTQVELASAISMDRSALAKIESGTRRVTALELARIADAVNARIEWFLEDAPPAIVSRRNTQEPGAPSPRIDMMVERITREVELLARYDTRFVLGVSPEREMPTDAAAAETLAGEARGFMGVDGDGPCTQLADKVAAIGLLVFSFDLGVESADAATILLRSGGVSVVNGSMRVGRRRLALAHELGHYLVADEYTVDWRVAEYQDIETRENLLDRFARALLLPANGLRQAWAAYTNNDDDDLRSTAVRVASQYRVDMATLARRLHELRIVGYGDVERVRAIRTNRADIVEMGLVVVDELAPPSLSSEYVKSVLRLYRSETVSMERAIDLLFDTWDEEMLPDLPPRSEDEIWQFI